jgi:hypothetical protein
MPFFLLRTPVWLSDDRATHQAGADKQQEKTGEKMPLKKTGVMGLSTLMTPSSGSSRWPFRMT